MYCSESRHDFWMQCKYCHDVFPLFFSFLILVIRLNPDLNQIISSDGRYALSLSDRKISNLFVDRH